MTFGGKGNFAKVGNLQLDGVRKLIDIVADAGVEVIDTADVYSGGASEELIGEAMGAEAQARHADRHQGALSDGRGAQRSRPFPLASDPRLRSELEAAQDRRHQPLSGASVGRPDPAGGDHGGARHLERRQGALHRLLELVGLAHDEGDGGRAPRWAQSVRFSEQIG